jgi:hypothetical protein
MQMFVIVSSFFCFFSGNGLHCIGLLLEATSKFAVFCCITTLMWTRRTTRNGCRPYYYFAFYEAKLCLRKSNSFFCFPSDNGLHCITVLSEAALKLPVFWFSRKLTSLRGTCASALPPLTIFHSLSALQRWRHCTQIGHRLQQARRCRIPARHRRS